MKKGAVAAIARRWNAQELEEAARGERNARVCRRLLALRQLALGHSLEQAAQVSLVKEFEARYSLSGVYALLHRLKLSNLVPRPQHPDSDAAAQAAFKKSTRRTARTSPSPAP